MKKVSRTTGLILILVMLFSIPAPAFAAGRQEALYPDEIVILGAYEQDGNKSNGPEDIQWRVLEARGDYALLISKDILDARRYNSKRTEVTWEECSLREWLNNDFFESAFSDEEQDAILTTTVDNSREQGNSGWRRSGGNETEDKVFLLSYAELRKYFDKDKERTCKPTEYAAYRGVWADKNGTSHWWLRSPGSSQFYSAYCSYKGSVSDTWNTNDAIGVRPVIRVDLSAFKEIQESDSPIISDIDDYYYVDVSMVSPESLEASSRLLALPADLEMSNGKLTGFKFVVPIEDCVLFALPIRVFWIEEGSGYDKAEWCGVFRNDLDDSLLVATDSYRYIDEETFSFLTIDARDQFVFTLSEFALAPWIDEDVALSGYHVAVDLGAAIFGFETREAAEQFYESLTDEEFLDKFIDQLEQ